MEFQLWGPDDTEVAEGEVGEIVIRGENVMKGYWNNPDATAEAMRAGWFHSGDLATRDDDGFYFIVDRKKDMIIRNGMNVYPREVEEVLYTHPAVAEAAVFGVPDALHGEEIACLVSLKEGADAPRTRSATSWRARSRRTSTRGSSGSARCRRARPADLEAGDQDRRLRAHPTPAISGATPPPRCAA